MKRELKLVGGSLSLNIVRILSFLIFIGLFVTVESGFAQEDKETSDKFTYLIENGARMIRGNEFEKVLDMIGELPSEKKGDFRVKALENSAYLKGYVVTKNKVYGKKWEVSYKSLIYSTDK